jgi:hypothetical protein
MHTPDIMNKIICASMDSWLDRRPVVAPLQTGPEEPIQCQLRSAFHAQSQIGWDQFFRGRIAKTWIFPIGTYYKHRQPGASFTPEQWMQNAITELWKFSITLWKQQNTEYHGTDLTISLEHWQKESALEAEHLYQETIGKVSPTDSHVLHSTCVDEILKWTQEHLDAYLASADIIIVQCNEAVGYI